MRSLWTILVALLLFGAGCISDDVEPEQTENPDEEIMEGTPEMVSSNGTGTVTNSVGTPVVSFGQGNGGEFTVEANATLVFAEIAWNTTDSLSLALDSPDGDGGNGDTFEYSSDNTTSPHNLTITAEDAGENWEGNWRLTAFAEGAVLGTEYTWAVTVFYGAEQVPMNFTALP